jgi:hypothetical protein
MMLFFLSDVLIAEAPSALSIVSLRAIHVQKPGELELLEIHRL